LWAASSFFRGGQCVVRISTSSSVSCAKLGKTVDKAIYEAVEEWIAMPEAEKREILGRQ